MANQRIFIYTLRFVFYKKETIPNKNNNNNDNNNVYLSILVNTFDAFIATCPLYQISSLE